MNNRYSHNHAKLNSESAKFWNCTVEKLLGGINYSNFDIIGHSILGYKEIILKTEKLYVTIY
jgi:hypothetical protein